MTSCLYNSSLMKCKCAKATSAKTSSTTYKRKLYFLTPFIPLLINPQKEHGLKGVSPFAKLLHLLVNFMDADGSGNTLNPDCIEDEIYKLFNELYPKE